MEQERARREALFAQELQDLLAVEKHLVEALPKMARSSSENELMRAVEEHLAITRSQVQRLESIFDTLSSPASGARSDAEREHSGEQNLHNAAFEAVQDATQVIDIDDIIARARSVFGNKSEAASWLHEHCAALQSAPNALLGTPEGRAEILNVLACIDHGMIY